MVQMRNQNIRVMVRGPTEEWREHPDWPQYEVSNYGKVRAVVGRQGTRKGKPLKPVTRKSGHLAVCFCVSRKKKWFLVHTLVAECFIGPKPSPKHEICHYDGNPTNNHVSNLRWGTRADNEDDKLRHGTSNRGSRHGMAKLTEDNIREIRKMRFKGMLHREIAECFGVNRKSIGDILSGRLWSHVK